MIKIKRRILVLKTIKWLFAMFLIVMFLINFLRQWTEVPAYRIIYITPEQENLNTTRGLGDYLKWGNTFAFFTTLSNIIAFFLIFIEWGSFGLIKVNKKLKLGALLYMIVTALVFWTTIAPFMPWGFDWFFDYDNVHEHFIVLIGIIWFVLSDKRNTKIKIKDHFLVLIYPILYLIMTSAIFFATPEHIAIYPFLDYYNFFGLGMIRWLSIIITIFFILFLLFIFIISYYFLIKLDNKRYNTIYIKGGGYE